MKELPKGLTNKVEAVFESGTDGYEKADLLGQALANMNAGCASNDIRWFLGGLVYGHTVKTGAVQIVKDLIEALNTSSLTDKYKNYNYNDLDCDLKGNHLFVPHECLTCSSLVAHLDEDKKPDVASCERCKGTAIDPEYGDDIYVLRFRDHSSTQVYVIIENTCRVEFHIRDLPRNLSKKKTAYLIENITQAAKEDQYDNKSSPFFSYRDGRDEGFVVSMNYGKFQDWNPDHEISHECAASLEAINAIDTISQHFICVIDELKEKHNVTA
jgi:hypothetical protein